MNYKISVEWKSKPVLCPVSAIPAYRYGVVVAVDEAFVRSLDGELPLAVGEVYCNDGSNIHLLNDGLGSQIYQHDESWCRLIEPRDSLTLTPVVED